jgi:hypothetical protein
MRLFLLLLACSLVACAPTRNSGDDDDSAGSDDDDDATSDDDDAVSDDDDDDVDPDDDDDDLLPTAEPVQICPSISTGVTQVDGWAIGGDSIRVSTWRSGGCEDWTYDLCWDGFFLESFPVQVNLYLQEFGDPDPCEAEVTEELEFSLITLQDAYIDSYGEGSADIIVNFASDSGTYSF